MGVTSSLIFNDQLPPTIPRSSLSFHFSNKQLNSHIRYNFQQPKFVEYTQANIIVGTAGQLSSVPTSKRCNPTDLFLPVDSLTNIYPLVLTLAALYSNSSLALNSVAGKSLSLSYQVSSFLRHITTPIQKKKTCLLSQKRKNFGGKNFWELHLQNLPSFVRL
jgi:hypothetical protein